MTAQDQETDRGTDELYAQGQPLVHSLAVRVHRSVPIRADLDDLIAYGELGLAQAVRDFDPDRRVEFGTFAYYRIRGAIYDGLAKMTWTSRAQYRRLRYEQLAEEALVDQANDAPGDDLGSNAAWFRGVTDRLVGVYLTSQVSDGESEEPTPPDPGDSAPAIVAQREISERLLNLVDELPHVERRLIRAVYLDGKTLDQAGKQLGFSRSWASRLHARALEGLARALKSIGAD
ncbi:MAG: sigma-70 family RNA polymerase sigma factor [Planctomycetota bacterium]